MKPRPNGRATTLAGNGMTGEYLTAILAERVLGWRICPDRFLTGNRGWLSRDRFRPVERLQDAFKLVIAASPTEYRMGGLEGKPCWARVTIGTASGEASAPSLPLAICLAVGRAVGIDVAGIL